MPRKKKVATPDASAVRSPLVKINAFTSAVYQNESGMPVEIQAGRPCLVPESTAKSLVESGQAEYVTVAVPEVA